ncbi:lysophospholipid acyltransferase family protein [Planctomicrobium piriforme]|uniref:1-acyl-sn-glycerol-3-phosphate acyltransferases n=1 Tax=Planctomicrobium piriforme TaxID=1576369 RepID=A0A1I3E8X1_9PLAN|nr:lysophospholipid acyltransferase family protein [Planctomicrobium piriforme]SFH95432.1 1-acyl-sn-glycerol-3-phosphate acyltransferases [Planctomicrobium piriforme]
MLVVLGLNVRRRHLLPNAGPAVVIANHNSHLDAIVLMTLFGMQRLKSVHPVAASDYFLKNRWLAWFSTQIIGISPLDREVAGIRKDPLAGICEGLSRGDILILFPEGSRGEPEKLAEFHTGIAHIAKRFPQVPIVPVFMHGLGKALPRGEGILVPFFVDVFVGEPVGWTGNRNEFMDAVKSRFDELVTEGHRPEWT